MSDTSDLPVLISTYYQVVEQIQLLVRDIERNKWDAGMVVMVNNGTLDMRGLGEVKSTVQAKAILFAAFQSLPPATQAEMLSELTAMFKRSHQIESEAELWRVKIG